MGRIKILPNNLINQIAAGEVIERPASVVKELVENSIDAGASRIDILITDGGHSRIEIRDNGSGMEIEDLKLAFVRHATSKISSEHDLMCIQSLGFRGEALPSISSVSKVTVQSRTAKSNAGNQIILEAGEILTHNIVGCPIGTTIIVGELFYNTPARLKFMGSPRAESQRITSILQQLALSHPEIAFRFFRDGREIAVTVGNNDVLNVISVLYEPEIVNNLLHLEFAKNGYTVQGYISAPSYSKHTRKQNFYVNGRVIQDSTIRHALEAAYGNMLPPRKFPLAFLFIEMPLTDVDVNVHPTKSEVRFANKSAIHGLITAAVREALANSLRAANDSKYFDAERKSDINLQVQEPQYTINIEPSIQHSIMDKERFNLSNISYKQLEPIKKINESIKDKVIDHHTPSELRPKIVNIPEELTQVMILGQIHNSFIVLQNRKGMLIMDQHAAHERIIIEQLRNFNKESHIQYFAVPITISFTKLKFHTIKDYLAEINDLGIIMECFGTNSFVIRGIPDFLSGNITVEDLKDIIEEIFNEDFNIKKWHDNFLIEISCRSAIKIHQVLTREEMIALIRNLANTSNWRFCPHGRPTVWEVSFEELERIFKRA